MTFLHGRAVRTSLSIALLTCLTACGSGGGSDSSPPDSDAPPPAPTPTLNTFSTQIIYRDECGEAHPHPYAEVFLHDSAGNVVERQMVDSEGRVSFSREESAMPVTVVTQRRPSTESNNYVTFEYFDQLPMTNLGRISALVDSEFQVDGTCSCSTGTLTVDAPAEAPDAATRYSFSRRVNKGDNNVTVCESNDAWPYHWAAFEGSFSSGSSALLVNNFDALRDTGEQVVVADIQSVNEPVNGEFQIYSSYARVDGFPTPVLFSSSSNGGDIYIYPTHDFISQTLYRSAGIDFLNDELNTIVFKRIYSPNPSEFAGLNNDVIVPDLASLDVSSLGETGVFDFSPVSDMPFLWIDMVLSSPNHTVVYRYNGLTSGRITDTVVYTGYEQYLNNLDVERVSFQFFNYDNLEPTASALSAAIFSIEDDQISTQNYETHYRRFYEYVSFDINGSDISQQAQSLSQIVSTSSHHIAESSGERSSDKKREVAKDFREREKGLQ